VLDDPTFAVQWEAMTQSPDALDDPVRAAHAWRRFRRMLAWMGLGIVIALAIMIGLLEYWWGPLSWIAILAAIGGLGGSMLLGSALMGLTFLSSGTGHDEAIDDVVARTPISERGRDT
jgi:hypothetical protein